jgi:hypothetical protein
MLDPASGPTKALVALVQSPVRSALALTRELQSLRASLSVSLLRSVDPTAFLTQLWLLLLALAPSNDTSVSVAACSAAGAAILSISPFDPNLLARTFAVALRRRPTASFFALATATNIADSLSPLVVPGFIRTVAAPIGDLSSNVQHVPGIAAMLDPTARRKVLVDLIGLGAGHTAAAAIVALVAEEPATLLPILVEKVRGELLVFAPGLVANDRIRAEMDDHLLAEVTEIALQKIRSSESSLSEIEYSCGVLSTLANTGRIQGIRQAIRDAMRDDYPTHYRRFLLLISENIQDFVLRREDSWSVQSAKLTGLSHYLAGTTDPQEIISGIHIVEEGFNSTEENVKTVAFVVFRNCLKLFWEFCQEKTLHIFRFLINCVALTWVQKCELATLVKETELFQDHPIVLDRIIEFAVSRYQELADLALSCIRIRVNFGNLVYVVQLLQKVDIFESFLAAQWIRILIVLVDTFGFEYFRYYGNVVSELIVYHSTPKFASLGFRFLKNIRHFKVTRLFGDVCADWICILYKAIVHEDSKAQRPGGLKEIPKMTMTVDPNILAVRITDLRNRVLQPLQYCLEYFLSIAAPNDYRAAIMIHEMVRLFPEVILAKAIDFITPIPTPFHQEIVSLIRETHSMKTAAACCEFMCYLPVEFRRLVTETVVFLMKNCRMSSGAHVFSFYRLLQFSDVPEVDELLLLALKSLSETEVAFLEAKLCVNDPRLLSQFAQKTNFRNWPVADDDFRYFFERSDIHVTVDEFGNIDENHWKFVFDNFDRFALADFEDYRIENFARMRKFTLRYEQPDIFEFVPVSGDVDRGQSILPILLRGEIPENICLLNSFFRFSSFHLQKHHFDALFELAVRSQDPDVILQAVQYSSRQNLPFNHQLLLENCMETIRSSPHLLKSLSLHIKAKELQLPETIDLRWINFDNYDFQSFTLALNSPFYAAQLLEDFKFKFKSSNLIFLCKLVSRFQIPSTLILGFFLRNQHGITTSPKRILSALRLLRITLLTVKQRPKLYNWLLPLVKSDISLVHNELGKLFIRFEVPATVVQQAEVLQKSFQRFTPYLSFLAILFSYSNAPVGVSRALLVGTFLPESFPSVKFAGLNVIEDLLKGLPHGWLLFQSALEVVYDGFSELHDLPFFNSKVTGILRMLIQKQEFRENAENFCRIFPFVFDLSLTSPATQARISMLPSLISIIPKDDARYNNFMKLVLAVDFVVPFALTIIHDYSKWRMLWPINDHTAYVKSMINSSFRFLMNSLTDENLALYLDVLWLQICEFELSFNGFWGLVAKKVPELKLCLAAKLFRKRCSPQQIEDCKQRMRQASGNTEARIVEMLVNVFDKKGTVAIEILSSE